MEKVCFSLPVMFVCASKCCITTEIKVKRSTATPASRQTEPSMFYVLSQIYCISPPYLCTYASWDQLAIITPQHPHIQASPPCSGPTLDLTQAGAHLWLQSAADDVHLAPVASFPCPWMQTPLPSLWLWAPLCYVACVIKSPSSAHSGVVWGHVEFLVLWM